MKQKQKKTMTSLMLLVLCVAIGPLSAQGRGHMGGSVGGMGGAHMGAGMGAGMGSEASTMRAGSPTTARANTMSKSQPSVALANNTRLASRTQALLPAGETVKQASAGFKNTGQFLAAVHVSHNLGIPFDQLKARTTGPQRVSLGKAIHELRANTNAKAQEKKAKAQARADLEAQASKNGGRG
jgi:hypothetical protein